MSETIHYLDDGPRAPTLKELADFNARVQREIAEAMGIPARLLTIPPRVIIPAGGNGKPNGDDTPIQHPEEEPDDPWQDPPEKLK